MVHYIEKNMEEHKDQLLKEDAETLREDIAKLREKLARKDEETQGIVIGMIKLSC